MNACRRVWGVMVLPIPAHPPDPQLGQPITLLVLVAGLNGIAAAPFLIVVMSISGNRRLMGDSRNGGLAAVLGWFTVALMTAAAIAMLALPTGV